MIPRLIFFTFVLLTACSDTTRPSADANSFDQGDAQLDSGHLGDIEVDSTDSGSSWHLPEPRFSYDDYLTMASGLCSTDGDRAKLILSIQLDSYHVTPRPLAFRNGEGEYLFVNSACEAWMMAGPIAESYLQMPLYRKLTIADFAGLLENSKRCWNSQASVGLDSKNYPAPNYIYIVAAGESIALGQDYRDSYLNRATGQLWPEVEDLPFADYELLAMAVLDYRFWEDGDLLGGAEPYRGDKLWLNVTRETFPNIFPDRLVQDWPLDSGPEEMGVVALDPVCSNAFFHVSGEAANDFRTLRDRVLAMEPMDSNGHWTVPMRFGEKKYYVDMAEAIPMEDEDGWIPFMGIRMRDVSCQE
ncbi:MAG: hypothetical protein R3E66_06400 [bacterium]